MLAGATRGATDCLRKRRETVRFARVHFAMGEDALSQDVLPPRERGTT